jgi:hypothetical protein
MCRYLVIKERIAAQITCALVLGTLLAGSGCSPIKIQNDFDKDADFRTYSTYDWLENRPGYAGRSGASTEIAVSIDKIIRTAILTELDGMGYGQNTEDPDVIVIYHTGMADQIDVSAWGYRYGHAYWGWHGLGADVYAYREGTLIVDLIDAETMTLVWRGAAQSTIDDPPNIEKAEKTIPEAVRKMFKWYPPAQ